MLQQNQLLKEIFVGKRIFSFDCETYPNYFCIIFYDGEKYYEFEINQLKELKEFIESDEKVLIGYNSKSFDDRILKYAMRQYVTTQDICDLASEIINRSNKRIWEKDSKYGKLISDLGYEYQNWISVDIFKILEANEINKVSLKERGIRANFYNIQELPVEARTTLNLEQQKELFKYCHNDVLSTWYIGHLAAEEISVRDWLKKNYSMFLSGTTNSVDWLLQIEPFCESDAGLASNILLTEYSNKSKLSTKTIKNLDKIHYDKILIKDLIPENFKFETSDFQKNWEALKTGYIDIDEDKKKTIIVNNKKYTSWIMNVGGLTCALKLGGLHSQEQNQLITNDKMDIYDVDATSYYPNIIIAGKLHPAHLNKTWTDILNQITIERTAAKKTDKRKSQSLKIVINATFGQTGNPYSWMYDRKLLYEVTLRGQLFILKLAELYIIAGCQIISVNTDGVTVLVPKGENSKKLIEEINEKWQKEIGIGLEVTRYEKIAKLNVNNYIAIPEDKNEKIKAKGSPFLLSDGSGQSLKKKSDCQIVAKALNAYFKDNISIEKTILEADNIYDFIFSDKNPNITWGGEPTQKNIRWYVSTEGKSLKRLVKQNKTPNGDNAIICNLITDEKVPKDLNKQYYIDKALKILNKIEGKSNEKIELDLEDKEEETIEEMNSIDSYELSIHSLDVAKKLQDYGLTIIDKDNQKFSKGTKLDNLTDILSRNLANRNGLGIVNGAAFNTITIDIDNPSLFSKWDKIGDTLSIWHGKNTTKKEQIDAKGRIKLVYFYNEDKLKSSAKVKNFLQKYGIEILYENKDASFYGMHHSGEFYKHEGIPVIIPEKLLEYLTSIIKPSKKKIAKDIDIAPNLTKNEKFEILKEIVSSEIDISNLKETGTQLTGECPWHNEHTGKSENTFKISLDGNNEVHIGCFHTGNCKPKVDELWLKVLKNWKLLTQVKSANKNEIKINEPNIIGEEKEIKESITELFKTKSKFSIGIAPTGEGKSYASATEFLKMKKNRESCVYVANGLSDLEQFCEYIKQISGYSVEELGIFKITGETDENIFNIINKMLNVVTENSEWLEPTKKNSRGFYDRDLDASPIFILTHHTYLSRKGVSIFHYNLLQWISRSGATIIFDEIDKYCENQEFIIKLKQRYEIKNYPGSPIYEELRETCPSFERGENRCGNCKVGCGISYAANKFSIMEIKYGKYQHSLLEPVENLPSIYIKNYDEDYENDENDENDENGKYYGEDKWICDNLTQYYVKKVKFDPRPMSDRIFQSKLEENEMHVFDKTIEDMIQCSFEPAIYTHLPAINGKPVFPPHIRDENVSWPYEPCNIPYLITKDKSSLYYLTIISKKIIFLSATLSLRNERFIKNIIPDIKINVVLPTRKPIDKLLIVGVGDRIKLKKELEIYSNKLKNNGLEEKRTIIFSNKERETNSIFSNNKNLNVFRYVEHDLIYQQHTDHEYVASDKKILLTYIRSPLGRGINLANYHIAIIDASLRKPAYTYNTNSDEELKNEIKNEIHTMVVQAGGRILRGEGTKVIFVHGINEEMFNAVCEEYFKMSKISYKIYYKEQFDCAIDTGITWLKDDGQKPPEKIAEITKEEKIKNTPNDLLSPKQRKIKESILSKF